MSKISCVSAAAVVVILFGVTGALAEDAAAAGAGATGGGTKFGKAAVRERTIKEALGATDDEMKVLEPKIEAVRTLQKKAKLTIFGRRKSKAVEDQLSELEKKIRDLQVLAETKDVDAKTVKEKLKEFRDARDKSNAELKKAQDDLRELVTPRQEVQLILMGLLD